MKNINLKPFIFILLVFSGVVWFGIASASGLNMQNFIDFMRPIPKVVTADLLLVGIFMKWGWRWKRLQGWLIPFPDLNGTWEGHIQTNWKDANGSIPGPIPVILSIKQSFTRLSCVMRTAEMESHSYTEGFCIDKDAQVRRLCYSYMSRPKTALRDRSTCCGATRFDGPAGRACCCQKEPVEDRRSRVERDTTEAASRRTRHGCAARGAGSESFA